jgi:DEAD/DEAH box helicase domain-containing protein
VFGPQAGELLEALAEDGQVRAIDQRWYWASIDYPAARINLRTIADNTFTIVDATRGNEVLGTVDAISAPELVFPEAIYLHEGRSYFVRSLDLEQKVALCEPREVDYYTQPVIDTNIVAGAPARSREALGAALQYGQAAVSWNTIGMKKVRFHSLDSIGYKALDLPRLTLDTVTLAWTPPAAARASVRDAGPGAGRGVERRSQPGRHADARCSPCATRPTSARCSIPRTWASRRCSSSIRYPGGLGFAEQAYHRFEELLAACRALIADCPCDDGCPSCVGLPILRPPQQQDPDLGNGWPMPSKRAARALLDAVL